MPVKTEKKPSNPGLGGAFSNTKFGEGSVLLQVTAENYDVLMKNLQVGSGILFRFNKVTTKGNNHYFAEILPPMSAVEKPVAKSKAVTSDLD